MRFSYTRLLSLTLSLSNAVTFKAALIFLVLKHQTQLVNAPPLTEYNNTPQLHLLDEASLCQWEVAVMNDVPPASKCYSGKCCRGFQGGGFILLFFLL